MTRHKNDPVGQIAFRHKLTPAPNELTDDQVGKIDAYLRAHPGCGWKAALGSVGFYAPREQAKALILASADLAETRWQSLGVTEGQLTNVIGDIASNPEHPKRLDAAKAGLKMFHGYSEQPTTVSHEHTGEVNNPDVAAAIERFTTLTAAAIRSASRGEPKPPALDP